MKQTIEIEVPEGKKAVWKDDKIIFEDIAPQLPETWEEFCKLYPIKEEEVFIDVIANLFIMRVLGLVLSIETCFLLWNQQKLILP